MTNISLFGGLIFFLIFYVLMIGNMSLSVVEMECPGWEKRYICTVSPEKCEKGSEMPTFFPTLTAEKKIEGTKKEVKVEKLVDGKWEQATSVYKWIDGEWVYQYSMLPGEVEISAETNEGLFSGWVSSLTSGLKQIFQPVYNFFWTLGDILITIGGFFYSIIGYLGMMITAIGSPCLKGGASIRIISIVIISPVVLMIVMFLIRIIRGS